MPSDAAQPSEVLTTAINSDSSTADAQRPYSKRRDLLAAGLTAFAILLMILSAILQLPAERAENPPLTEAMLATLVGGAALIVATRLSSHKVEAGQIAEYPMIGGHVNWLLVIVGVLLLMLGTEMSANVFKSALYDLNPHVQFVTLFSGLVLFTVGMIGVRSLPSIHLSWRETLPVLAILVLAFAVRVYKLDTLIHMSVDEGQHMWGIFSFFDPTYKAHLLTTVSRFLPATLLYHYGNYATTLIWGQNLIGLRMASVILGTLTVLVVYGAGRALFNHRIGVLSALILSTFPVHLFYSRVSIASIADPLFGTLAIMFAARAFRWNRRADWVLMGVSLGLSQYFFEGGRLLFPIVFIGWIILTALVHREKFNLLRHGVALAMITNIVVITPMYFTMWYTEAPFTTRMNDSRVDFNLFGRLLQGGLEGEAATKFLYHITDPFLAYTFNHHQGMPDLYSGIEPLVLRVCVPLFLLGVFHCIGRLQAATLILLIAIFGASAGNIFVSLPLVFPRYLTVVPTLAILVALGLGCTLPMLNPFSRYKLTQAPMRGKRQWMSVAVTFGLTSMFSAIQAFYVFGHLIPEYNYSYRASFTYRDTVDAAFRYVERPEAVHEQMIIYDYTRVDPHFFIEQIYYFIGAPDYRVELINSPTVTLETLDALPRDRTYVFFVEPTDTRIIDLLHQSFTLEPPTYSPWENPLVRTLYIMFVAPHEENTQPRHLDT